MSISPALIEQIRTLRLKFTVLRVARLLKVYTRDDLLF